MDETLDKHYVFLIYVALALATVVAFEPVRHNEFVNYDDDEYVAENPDVAGGVSRESVVWAFKPHVGNWHPLTWLSHMLDCELFGLEPLGHHLTNLLFHIVNTLLLFYVLKRMTGSVLPSGFVAALFALHPVHVESVAWVAERKDVLSGFFWMLTMAAYIRYAERPGIGRYVPVLLFFGLGLMAKPMLVTLPFVLILLNYWPLDRFRKFTVYRLIGEMIPLFVLMVASGVNTFRVQQSAGAMGPGLKFPLSIHISNAFTCYLGYILKMVYPVSLAPLYPHPGGSLPIWQAIVSVCVLVIITAVVIYMARRRRYLAVGWLWYLGTLVPVIGLVQVGVQAMADRYTYLPSIGFFIMVAWCADELFARWQYRKVVLGTSVIVVLVVLLMCTRRQVRYWQNDFTLFGHTLAVTENNFIMQNNYGNSLLEDDQFEEAIAYFDEALRINPGYAKALKNKGRALLELGDIDEAIECFTGVLHIRGDWPEVYHNLGLAYAEQDKHELAIKNYNKALQLKPEYPNVLNNLGASLKKQGRIDEAIKRWEKALAFEPDHPNAHFNMGLEKAKRGKYDDAISHFKQALQAKPDWPEVYYNIGAVYYRQGKLDLAVEHCSEAVRLKPDYLKANTNLAQGLFELGKISQAIEAAEKALELAESAGEAEMVEELQNRLRIYRASLD
jgi:tetratricopeptide (TPR) repeat protein